ncbi:4-hydroxybenzoate polyprenyltransferase [Alteromonadaceae bacterium 2753L.S.0a.02]|nr:4-hydroxybenzoate polyprenyltransferase [Alteromonadaceae bacterium 2753L.S.0a.02]
MGVGVPVMKLATAFELGRVSNLPTVWTNVLVGVTLSGSSQWPVAIACMLAVSLLYLAGMFLNDACDARWDAEHGQQRPIVRGDASLAEVYGFAVLFTIISLAVLLAFAQDGQKIPVAIFALALIAAIVGYDIIHKHWAHSAWIMGACRLLVYLTAGALVAPLNTTLLLAGLALLLYIAGITYLARTEHLNQLLSSWPLLLLFCPLIFCCYQLLATPNLSALTIIVVLLTLAWILYGIRFLMPGPARKIPKAIGVLLAGLCLIDASVLAVMGQGITVLMALCAFGLCLMLQKMISAT